MAHFLSGLLLFSSVFLSDARASDSTAAVYELSCDDMGFDSAEECEAWCDHFDREDEAGTCAADSGLAQVGFFQNRTARAFLRWYADADVTKVGAVPRS